MNDRETVGMAFCPDEIVIVAFLNYAVTLTTSSNRVEWRAEAKRNGWGERVRKLKNE
jgi:hypothetical protein